MNKGGGKKIKVNVNVAKKIEGGDSETSSRRGKYSETRTVYGKRAY